MQTVGARKPIKHHTCQTKQTQSRRKGAQTFSLAPLLF